jgi:hypothetical protein
MEVEANMGYAFSSQTMKEGTLESFWYRLRAASQQHGVKQRLPADPRTFMELSGVRHAAVERIQIGNTSQ